MSSIEGQILVILPINFTNKLIISSLILLALNISLTRGEMVVLYNNCSIKSQFMLRRWSKEFNLSFQRNFIMCGLN